MPASERDRPRQLPLELGHRPEFSRDHLVVSPANAEAVSAIDRWPDWPSPVMILAGPTGSGKSHLARIWAAKAAADRVAPENLAQQAGGIEPERGVVVDGIEPGRFEDAALFHLINEVRSAKSWLLLTSRHFPSAWGVTLPDLQSRLKAATLVEIGEPDDLLLAGVITKLFADRQIEIERHVVAYLISRIERSLSTAGNVVEKLDRAALEQQCRITRGLAAQIVNALDEGQAELDL